MIFGVGTTFGNFEKETGEEVGEDGGHETGESAYHERECE
jgi:hypothetical protein